MSATKVPGGVEQLVLTSSPVLTIHSQGGHGVPVALLLQTGLCTHPYSNCQEPSGLGAISRETQALPGRGLQAHETTRDTEAIPSHFLTWKGKPNILIISQSIYNTGNLIGGRDHS